MMKVGVTRSFYADLLEVHMVKLGLDGSSHPYSAVCQTSKTSHLGSRQTADLTRRATSSKPQALEMGGPWSTCRLEGTSSPKRVVYHCTRNPRHSTSLPIDLLCTGTNSHSGVADVAPSNCERTRTANLLTVEVSWLREALG